MIGRSPRSAGWLLAGSGLAVALRRRVDRLQRTPEDVRDARAGHGLGQALRRGGGVYAELGLELAARPELGSGTFRAALSAALAAGDALPFAAIQAVLEQELGAAHRHFSWIDPLPLEHSAVTQVHRARLHDGPLVEVRVRPPSLDPERVRADLRRLRRAAPLLQRWLAPASARDLLDDLGRAIEEAIDLAHTGHQAGQLAAALAHDRAAVVPEVCWPATARGILTLEWVPRFPLGAAAAQGLKTDECLATLLRIYAPRLLAGAFHTRVPADAVWLVNESVPDEALPGGQPRLLVLDFAMSRALPEPLRREIVPLLCAVAARSAPALRAVLDRLGAVRRGCEAAVDRALAQLVTGPEPDAPVELLPGVLGDAAHFQLAPELLAWTRSLAHVARLCRALDAAQDPLRALLGHAS